MNPEHFSTAPDDSRLHPAGSQPYSWGEHVAGPGLSEAQEAQFRSPAEIKIREDLAEAITKASEGTVGIQTSMDLSREEKERLDAVQLGRTGRDGNRRFTGQTGGVGEYGEVATTAFDWTFRDRIRVDQEGEELHMRTDPDGVTHFRYAAAPKGYFDDSGRPNSLIMDFALPGESADKLRTAVAVDPTYIHTVVEKQVTAVGISQERWDTQLRPVHGDLSKSDRGLTFFEHDAAGTTTGQQKLDYANRKPLSEALSLTEPIAPDSEAVEASASEKSYGDYYAEAEQLVANEAENGGPEMTLSFLTADQMTYDRDYRRVRQSMGEESPQADAMHDATLAYETVYNAYLTEKFAAEGGEKFLDHYVAGLASNYLQENPAAITDPDIDPFKATPVTDKGWSMAGLLAYELQAAKNATSWLQSERKIDDNHIPRIYDRVRTEAASGA